MKTPAYTLITETNTDGSNPGDIMIGQGIEHLLRSFEERRDHRAFPLINHQRIFASDAATRRRAFLESDTIVVCGTPQLNDTSPPPSRFNASFYRYLWDLKRAGKKILNLWAGFGATDYHKSDAAAVASLVERHGGFIRTEFPVYDLVVARDAITERTLAACGIPCLRLLDCVSWAVDYHRLLSTEYWGIQATLNLIALKALKGHGARLIRALEEVYRVLGRETEPTWFLCHSAVDYAWFRERLPGLPLLCVTDPRDLLRLYWRVRRLVSFRIHGTVPAAACSNVDLTHIYYDSRRSIIEGLGGGDALVPFDVFMADPTAALQTRAIVSSFPMLHADRDCFFEELENVLPEH